MPASNRSAGVNYTQTPEPCYTLTLGHTGSGANPTASPAASTGCSTSQYHAGEVVTLTASPTAGWEVDSWWGTNNNTSTATTNIVTMPASNRSAGVNYTQTPEECYLLTLGHSGSGANPTASPAASTGCSTGQYHTGEVVTLTASPAAGWEVDSWYGTNNNASTSTTNTVTMPASNRSAGVNYTQTPEDCYVLTLNHTGSGSDPTASPTSSSGCSTGQYHAGEVVTLTASPAAGWEVSSWWGTNNNASTATNNSVTMPAANRSAGVNYAQSGGPALQLTKEFAHKFVIAGTSGHTFALTVTNVGTGVAQSVRVQDTVPADLKITSVDCAGGSNNSAGPRADCTFAALAAAGGSATATVTYELKASASPQETIVNEATADDAAGNHAEASDSIIVAEPCGTDPLTGETIQTAETRAYCGAVEVGPAFDILSPGDLTLVAGDGIVLRDGFVVGAGAQFVAAIDPALAGN
jgi:hypothetical protein